MREITFRLLYYNHERIVHARFESGLISFMKLLNAIIRVIYFLTLFKGVIILHIEFHHFAREVT